ncbi:MAG TPA: hypothetical protein VFI73_00480 [Candidatus Nitrosopolaris sp.]|nr:hypothetical protein [Candidatus Nitrosopolaris sp.]
MRVRNISIRGKYFFGAQEDHSSQAVCYSELNKSNVPIGYPAENRKGRQGVNNAKNEIKSLLSSMVLPRKVRGGAFPFVSSSITPSYTFFIRGFS